MPVPSPTPAQDGHPGLDIYTLDISTLYIYLQRYGDPAPAPAPAPDHGAAILRVAPAGGRQEPRLQS